jgi:hypothetical protein
LSTKSFLASSGSSASIEIIAVRKRHDLARQMKWQAPFLLLKKTNKKTEKLNMCVSLNTVLAC